MSWIKNRAELLNKDEKVEFINIHLLYRLKILKKAVETFSNLKINQFNDKVILDCIFEASLIYCRMFMQFLGLGINGDNPPKLKQHRKYYSSDGINSFEVKVSDLGGSFVEIEKLKKDEQNLLANVYLMANKASAHLTWNTPHNDNAQEMISAARLILRLIDENLLK